MSKQCFEFNGVEYGVGTIMKIPITNCRWGEPLIEEVRFVGGSQFNFIRTNGAKNLYDSFFDGTDPHYHKTYINYIEVVKPVYYQEPEPPKPQNIFFSTASGSWDAHNQVCIGFIWYIVIMLLAIIFKARIAIWILATFVYFLWKSKK